MLKQFLLFCSIFFAFSTLAQEKIKPFKLAQNKHYSQFTHVFQLDSAQARLVYQKRWVKDTSFFYTHKVDSFQTDSASFYDLSKLGTGHFLLVKAQNHNINFQVKENPYFDVQVIGFNEKTWLKVYDLQGKVLEDATVEIRKWENKKVKIDQFKYNKACGCYPIPRRAGMIKVFQGDEFTYVNLSVTSPSRRRNRNRSSGGKIFPGYMVTNQPKYRMLDTVKTKAFIVNKRGKPLRKKLRFVLTGMANPTTIATKKPITPGAYVHEFVLGDSLKLDRNYGIAIQHKRKYRNYKYRQFYLEDYELDKVTYKARMGNNYVKKGFPVEIFLSATDANNLPIFDGKAKITVRFQNLIEFYDKKLFIPDAWKNNFYTKEILLETAGETRIVIPDSLFPNAKMTFYVQVQFKNSNNELETKNLNFTYDPEQEIYEMGIVGDSIFVNYLFEGKSAAKYVKFNALNQNRILESKKILLPFKEKITSYPTSFEIRSLGEYPNEIFDLPMPRSVDSLLGKINLPQSFANLIYIKGKRSFDSVQLELVNPFGFMVNYEIYKMDKLIEQKRSKTMIFKAKDFSEDSYHVIFNFQYFGKEYLFENSFHIKEKTLNIDINQPETIYPGQEIPISVKVTDYQNKALKNVNLTAYAINSQFDNIPIPEMPYLGKYRSGFMKKRILHIHPIRINYSKVITNFQIENLNLRNEAFYKLLYARGFKGMIYDSIQNPTPELAVYVRQRFQDKAIFGVYLDNEPIYLLSSDRRPNSYRHLAGKYDLKIRTYDKLYSAGEIELKPYQKLHVCFNADSVLVKDSTAYVTMDFPFVKEEEEALMNYFLYVHVNNQIRINHNFYVNQDSTVFSRFNCSQKNYKGKYYWKFGPLKEGYLDLVYPNDTVYQIYFDPAYVYEIQRDSSLREIQMDEEKLIPLSNFKNMKNAYNQWDFSKRAITLPKPPKPIKQKFVKRIPPDPQLKNYYPKNRIAPFGNLRITNSSGKNIKWSWYFNQADSTKSQVYFSNNTLINSLSAGNYQMVLSRNDSSFTNLKNFELKPNGTTYFRLENSDFQDYDSTTIERFKLWIRFLNHPDLRVFEKYPIIFERPTISYSNSKKTQFEHNLRGFVRDNNGYPIDQINVIVEKNGEFISGGLTNPIGYFVIDSLPKGTYDLKIFTNRFEYTIVKNVQILENKNALIDLRLYSKKELRLLTTYQNGSIYKQNLGSKEKINKSYSSYGNAKNGGKIRGIIRDSETNEPLPFVNVILEKDGKSMSLGCISNINGFYSINNLEPGKYDLRCSYIGYSSLIKKDMVVSRNKTISVNLNLRKSFKSLEELTFSTIPGVIVDVNGISMDSDYDGVPNALDIEEVTISANSINNISQSNSYALTISGESSISRKLPRAINKITAVSAGVFSKDDGNGVSIRGSIEYYIDGIKVSENSGTAAAFGDVNGGIESKWWANPLEEQKRLNELSQNQNVKKVRNIFRDYAFWVPNLLTNEKGEAHFTVQFPDNQTNWKTIVPAMSYKKHSGIGFAETRSYKPLSANLALPRFLLQGDSVSLLGKINNYTRDSLSLQTAFKVNDFKVSEKKVSIFELHLEKYKFGYEDEPLNYKKGIVPIGSIDTIQLTYQLQTDSGYADGEKRDLPIFLNGIQTVKADFLLAEKDTSFSIYPNSEIDSRQIFITNNRLDLVFEELQALKNYQYGCNEQTASKLKAVLIEKQLLTALNKEFKDERQIIFLIKRLEKNQNKNGSWGWWSRNNGDIWMTTYVASALNKASKAGYRTRGHIKAASYLRGRVNVLQISEKLGVLNLMADMGFKFDYEKEIKKMEKYNLSLQDEFQLLKLKQSQEIPIDLKKILTSYEKANSKPQTLDPKPSNKNPKPQKESKQKGIFWGEQVLNFKVNKLQTSMLAYCILREAGNDSLLKEVREYFFLNKTSNRNTVDRARILETFVPDLLEANNAKNELTSELKINNTLKEAKYPIRLDVKNTDTISFEKTGSPLHFAFYEYKIEKNPKRVDSTFRVNSYFIQEKDTIKNKIKSGKILTYCVDVQVKKSSEYVMIEIPIPAGCSYDNKAIGKNTYEVHREYFRNKVSIFCKRLPKGNQKFQVKLQPRFAGEFTVLPVQASLMYFPLQNGRNEKQKLSIEE